ncbi:MAG: polyphosphate polymerase domain-containing protein [Planctomycetes bacterium]|nr:polyphosphate polymerase domain-containing protein [Planctomycetota bacterium]
MSHCLQARQMSDIEFANWKSQFAANAPLPPQTQGAGGGDLNPLAQSLSPSLRKRERGDASAYEVKFLLNEDQARQIEQILAQHLQPDPHADPNLQNAYQVHTVYCDTPGFDVFHQIGSHRRRKYRVRRYGQENWVFLERKTKSGQRVRKLRTRFDLDELHLLATPPADADWSARWFHEQLDFRRLKPVCVVQYLRTAYIGGDAQGPLRLTFDRQVCGTVINGWTIPETVTGELPFPDQVIGEFKFRGALPAMFKSVIQQFSLEPTGVSKYRNCLRVMGGAGERGVPHV